MSVYSILSEMESRAGKLTACGGTAKGGLRLPRCQGWSTKKKSQLEILSWAQEHADVPEPAQ